MTPSTPQADDDRGREQGGERRDAGTAIVSVPTSGIDLEAVERALLVFALDATGGNRSRAAQLLRLTRSALLYRLQKYGLTVKQGSS